MRIYRIRGRESNSVYFFSIEERYNPAQDDNFLGHDFEFTDPSAEEIAQRFADEVGENGQIYVERSDGGSEDKWIAWLYDVKVERNPTLRVSNVGSTEYWS